MASMSGGRETLVLDFFRFLEVLDFERWILAMKGATWEMDVFLARCMEEHRPRRKSTSYYSSHDFNVALLSHFKKDGSPPPTTAVMTLMTRYFLKAQHDLLPLQSRNDTDATKRYNGNRRDYKEFLFTAVSQQPKEYAYFPFPKTNYSARRRLMTDELCHHLVHRLPSPSLRLPINRMDRTSWSDLYMSTTFICFCVSEKMAVIESQDHHPNVLIFPFFAHGHMIPLVDLAILLSQRGLTVTIVSTPFNIGRIRPTIDGLISSGCDVRVIELPFPCKECGLPENCENFEMISSPDVAARFMLATRSLKEPFEKVMPQILPDCVISDILLSWTSEVAHNFNIPRICFSVTCNFSSVMRLCLNMHKPQDGVSTAHEPFLVPGLPDKVELTKSQLPDAFAFRECEEKEQMLLFWKEVANAEEETDGIIVNGFYELEPSYVDCYKNTTGKPVWSVGPLFLCHEKRGERGKKSSIREEECLDWLGPKKERSVLYISFGSISFLSRTQMEEIKMGLKNLGCFFIWVVKELDDLQFIDSLEEETRDTGLIIRGWAPQAVILSHPSIGAFLTHCGWNSTIEAISFGQHLNEKLVVQILGIGVKVGCHVISLAPGEEDAVEVVKREAVVEAVQRVMGPGGEGESLRERASKVGDMARKAVEEQSGSSSLNVDYFVDFVKGRRLKVPASIP
ncbi:Scopoletin glucosyltransferase [Nymphaea thermarum]|nr:Scopoletin glucosyltransferase [Nymphaea thermarum]